MTDIWPPIKLLDTMERPPFPVDALTKIIKDYAVALAHSVQVPVDLPATLILTAISAPLAKRYVVQVTPDWIKPSNLYSVTVLPPAHRKSAIFKAVMQPIGDIEEDARRKRAPLAAHRASEIKVHNARVKNTEKNAIDADPAEQALAMQELHTLQGQIPEPIHLPRLVADNITQEKLISLLAENNGRLVVLSAEGGIFNIMEGQYKSGGGPDIDVYLKGHAGDHFRTDRMTRSNDKVDDTALTIGLTVQPGVLLEMVQNPGFPIRGLPARFLYSFPPAPLGARLIDTQSVLPPIRLTYNNLLKTLFRHSLKDNGDIQLFAETIYLDDDAAALFRDYRHENETALGEGQRLANIEAWGGKLCGAIIRIANVLHACLHHDNTAATRISVDTMARAITIGDYYEKHALAVFGQISGTTSSDAIHFVKWLIKQDTEKFRARDVFKALKSKRFKTMKDLWPALALLEERHYIRRCSEPEREGPGQKPSPLFEVNPMVLAQNGQNRQIA